MDSKQMMAQASDIEIHKALIAFMVSPKALDALRLMPMSSVQRFMEQLMTPSEVKAYLEFEASVLRQNQERRTRTDDDIDAASAPKPIQPE